MLSCPRCGEANDEKARFCSSCGLRLEASSPRPSEARKTVTVLFCDVVGSTGLAEQVDAETLRRVMTRYFDEIREVVERHEGVVEKFIGDAVMAVFGVPRVHEDDALRAVRAAMEIRRRLSDLGPNVAHEYGLQPAWRTGINTGEVVAGDAGMGQRFVTGDAVNVAARLEQAARPGEILIGAETWRLVHDAVAADQIGPIDARGRAAPVDAYRVLEREGEITPSTRRVETVVIGRRRAQRVLAEAFARVVGERACRLVTVLGSAGVGKTRLVEDFLGRLGGDVLVLRGRCLSYGEGITYWPIAEIVRHAAELSATDDDATFGRKVGGLIPDERQGAAMARRLGEMLGRFEGAAEQDEIFWAVRTFVHALAQGRPLILVLDDLHWAEPTLLDLIENLADQSGDVPLMFVCVARREMLESRSSWGRGKTGWTRLNLAPLTEAQTRQLVRSLLGRDALPAELVARIASAAEGNPLFVEEMLGLLIDSGQLIRQNGRWSAASDLLGIAVPASVHAVISARLDALPAPQGTLLGRASVEGKLFHRSAVIELMPDELHASVPAQLSSLRRKELVASAPSSFSGDEAYRFRHQLIRDGAYAALPKEDRSRLHERFAAWLTRAVGSQSAEYAEILGYHFEQAHRYRLALRPADEDSRRLGIAAAEHLGIAGRRALDRGDMHAARQLLERAVELTPMAGQGRTRLLADLADTLGQAGELQSADGLLRQAIEHADVTGDVLGRAWSELLRLDLVAGSSSATAEEIVQQSQHLLAMFEKNADERGVERAAFVLGQSHTWAGRVRLAEQIFTEHIDRHPRGEAPHTLVAWLIGNLYWGTTSVKELIRRIPDLVLASRPSRFVEAWALLCRGGAAGMIGEFAQGRQMITNAIVILDDLGQRFRALRGAGLWLGPLEMMAGDLEESERVLLDAYDSLRKLGDVGFSSTVAGNLAALYVRMGRFDAADEYARFARENAAADDIEVHANALSARARVLTVRGQLQAAEQAARQAIELVDETDYVMRRGWAWSDLAEVLAKSRTEEAIDALRHAAQIFAAKGATVEEARVLQRLGQLSGLPQPATRRRAKSS